MNNCFMEESVIDFILEKIENNSEVFINVFPSACSKNNIYEKVNNTGWTSSFWTGLLLLAYEYTHKKKYLDISMLQVRNFRKRLDNNIDLDNHDIGFLYSLSCVAVYKITNDEFAKETALLAAEKLYERYIGSLGIIHCWGAVSKNMKQVRIIIDCLMNLPLLFWASEVTGEKKYAQAAYTHADNALKLLIRDDNSTFHSYIFELENLDSSYGTTVQGYSESSCWSRGQAWAVYGFALSYSYTNDERFLSASEQCLEYYSNHLPDDFVPYWDLYFTKGNESRDTSAAAIAACGIKELLKYKSRCDVNYLKYESLLNNTLRSLNDKYTTRKLDYSNGILQHGAYNKPQNIGGDECLIWGDYFYAEALLSNGNSAKRYW